MNNGKITHQIPSIEDQFEKMIDPLIKDGSSRELRKKERNVLFSEIRRQSGNTFGTSSVPAGIRVMVKRIQTKMMNNV